MSTKTATFTKSGFGIVAAKGCRHGKDMLAAAGGNFNIQKVRVAYPWQVPGGVSPDGQTYMETQHRPIEAYAAVRSDTGYSVADTTVGKDYTVLQNSEVMDIIDSICQGHDLDYNLLGMVGHGRGMVVQVTSEELNKALSIGDDRNHGKLTISNFHDGTGSLKVHVSLLRLFCLNVLPALGREHQKKRRAGGNAYSIKHSKRMEDRINDMVKTYREAMGDLVTTADKLRLLANKKCKASEMQELFERIVSADGKSEAELTSRAKTQRENKLTALHELSKEKVNKVEGASGSWYEALQPLTHYGTHGIRTRDTGKVTAEERRFTSAHFGAGAEFSALGLSLALEMAGLD
jgi:hypothetical protein